MIVIRIQSGNNIERQKKNKKILLFGFTDVS